MTVDYYDVLQISPLAEQEVIESAYKGLARKYHSDRNHTGNAHECMTLINEAFSVLGNVESRQAYDHARAQSTAPGPPPTTSWAPSAAVIPTVPFPWRTFWRYPFGQDHRAILAVVIVFIVVLPVFIRWLLGSFGTGWFASLGGTISAFALLLMNWRSIPAAVLGFKPTSVGSEARYSPEQIVDVAKGFGSLVILSGVAPLLLLFVVNRLGSSPSVVGRAIFRLWIEWGVLAGGVPIALFWLKHLRMRTRESAGQVVAPVAHRLYAVALFASLAGGVIGPSSAYEFRMRAMRQEAINDVDAAISSLNAAIARHPGYFEAYEDRAALWKKKGDLDRAVNDLDAAINIDPESDKTLLMRAWLRETKKQTSLAVEDAARAVEICRRTASSESHDGKRLGRALADLSFFLMEDDKYRPSVQAGDEALKSLPSDRVAHYAKGRSLLELGDVDGAIASFDHALEAASEDAQSYWWRGKAHELKGDSARASADRAQAARYDPSIAKLLMAQSMLKSRFRPVAAPDPELTVSFRSSLVGKGQVLILRSKGIPANSVNIVINSDARFQIGDIGAWQSKELGWVELDRELRTGDTVQVFIGSKIVATSKVP